MPLKRLVVTFVVAAVTSSGAALLFRNAVYQMLARLVSPELAGAWQLLLTFAVFVVGLSSGVRIWERETQTASRSKGTELVELDTGRWMLGIYRMVIEGLQAITWVLLSFFSLALLAYAVVRAL